MIGTGDVQIVRDVMGSYGEMFTDGDLTNPTVLTMTAAEMNLVYPLAATETDPNRVRAITFAQAYLIAAFRIADMAEKTVARLGDMNVTIDVPVDKLTSAWMARAWTLLKRLYPAVPGIRTTGFFRIAPGQRGAFNTYLAPSLLQHRVVSDSTANDVAFYEGEGVLP
ncbi:MAG: hypothetical protein ACR2M1_10510 [Gemmatimonadaceae bacterium]